MMLCQQTCKTKLFGNGTWTVNITDTIGHIPESVQSSSHFHDILARFILTLSSDLLLGLPSVYFWRGVPIRNLNTFLVSNLHAQPFINSLSKVLKLCRRTRRCHFLWHISWTGLHVYLSYFVGMMIFHLKWLQTQLKVMQKKKNKKHNSEQKFGLQLDKKKHMILKVAQRC